MCGICGYVGSDSHAILPVMCASMAHRGPDDEGVWYDQRAGVGLGQRRLSIIDVSQAGHQPMCNEDGSVWITFNGEIYDYQRYRKMLLDKGHVFRSQTDTEVLIHLYEEKGPECLQELNGMFAMAIWDCRKEQLLLARDHAGIKPLYYWQNGSSLFFASEIKALMRIPGIPREVNYERVPDYLTFLWVPGRETLLKGIDKLESGCYLLWKNGAIEIKNWFELEYEPDETKSEGEWTEEVHEVLARCVRRQMVADVPLGAFLSGGLDSSTLVALMRECCPDREINCYTAAIDSEDNVRDSWVDDYKYAQQVARHLDVRLNSFVLKPDVMTLLPKLVYHMDEPDADPAVMPSYLICKSARDDNTTVLLSGTGGDEVFFGYNSHIAYQLFSRYERVPHWLLGTGLYVAEAVARRTLGAQSRSARRLRKFERAFGVSGLERHVRLVDWTSSDDRMSIYASGALKSSGCQECSSLAMKEYYEQFKGTGELNRHSHVLIRSFLASHNFLYTDKSSMATSVEVRVPFMDIELMRLCARIPERYKLRNGTTKYLLKKAMESYLPAEVVYRKKAPFGAPLRKWITVDLDPLVRTILSDKRIEERGLFDSRVIKGIVDRNRANMADTSYLIYALLTLELWMQTYIDRPGEEVKI